MKDWPVKQVENEYRRGAVLKHLAETPTKQLAIQVLKVAANAYGYPTSSEEMRDAVHYLERQGLVDLEDLGIATLVTLTERGRDLALGRETMPSVLIPEL